MKKMLFALVAAAAMCATFTGCDETPSKEVVSAASYALGTSSGLVVKLLNINDETRAVIADVIAKVSEVIPEDGQSFEDAWKPVAAKYIDELLESGKLPEILIKNKELTRNLLNKAVEAAFKGLDRLFEKYPTWKKYPDIVVAAVGGFVNGFKLTIGCTDCEARDVKVPRSEIDAEAKIIAERCGVTYK